MDYQNIISEIYKKIASEENIGSVANYIPELAKVDDSNFGIHLTTIQKDNFAAGNSETKFSIQSISKVLTLSLAYQLLGDKIWQRVGVEPSGTPFNSLVQLEAENGKPRNPFINSGALVVCDMLISELKNPKADFLAFIHNLAFDTNIQYSTKVAKSEIAVGYRNIALCYYLKSFGNIENNPEEVLDFYFNICALEMTCREMSTVFMFLADDNYVNAQNKRVLSMSQAKRINAIMQTCGFYDESGEFSFKVGLPGKSGVGGGIFAIFPDKYCITVWSPKLNDKFNSYRGMRFLEIFTSATESIF